MLFFLPRFRHPEPVEGRFRDGTSERQKKQLTKRNAGASIFEREPSVSRKGISFGQNPQIPSCVTHGTDFPSRHANQL